MCSPFSLSRKCPLPELTSREAPGTPVIRTRLGKVMLETLYMPGGRKIGWLACEATSRMACSLRLWSSTAPGTRPRSVVLTEPRRSARLNAGTGCSAAASAGLASDTAGIAAKAPNNDRRVISDGSCAIAGQLLCKFNSMVTKGTKHATRPLAGNVPIRHNGGLASQAGSLNRTVCAVTSRCL